MLRKINLIFQKRLKLSTVINRVLQLKICYQFHVIVSFDQQINYWIYMDETPLNRESQLTEEILPSPVAIQSHQQVKNQQQIKPKSKIRIKSLDIYRGLTMIGMIVVDNMGPIDQPFWWLDHAPWNGLTPADLIFPAFLFIMGMAIPLAVSQKRPANLKNLTRIAGLFLIGFFLNLLARKFNFDTVRVPGILQRLSICYAAVLLFHVCTKYGDKLRSKIGAFFMFTLFVVYIALMVSWDGGDKQGCTKQHNLTDKCNFAGYVDRLILTPDHMLKRVFTDPEGIFSTIGAILTTYLGYCYSIAMSKYKENPSRLALVWISISVIAGALTYPMTLVMPLNKKLYSCSFTLIVIAVSGASLTFFYFLIDILPSVRPRLSKPIEIITAPLLWLGLNPLAIFVLMDLVAIFLIYYIKADGIGVWNHFFKYVFSSWISDKQIAAAVFAFFFVVLYSIIAGVMHRFKFYVRL